jgi:uncharacterized protein (DUF2236 family)
MLGRLRRTATFVAGTTYGSRGDAERLIERVKRVHRTVVGTVPDGRSYSAEDPELLTWVHVAEVDSFLRAYMRYVEPGLSPADQDRYFDETRHVAEMLGARGVPRSRAEVREYFASVRPVLAVTERTREVMGILLRASPTPHPATRWVGKIFMVAGVDLLPPWAQSLIGESVLAKLRGPAAEAGVRAVAPVLRWALRYGAPARARERCGAPRTSAAPRKRQDATSL